MAKNDDKKTIRCSFCGKPQEEVGRIIAGPGAYICNECVHLCMGILGEDLEQTKTPVRLEAPDSIPTPQEIRKFLDQHILSSFCETSVYH